jgi:DnaJ-class molecular chaperone
VSFRRRGTSPGGTQLHLDHATTLFRRLGVDVQWLSAEDFKLSYYRLARRYHPDLNRNGHELMANINAARAAILKARQFDR